MSYTTAVPVVWQRMNAKKYTSSYLKFSDIFSPGSHDLLCTDKVQHHIHTGEAAPIRQQPRRLPLCKREEAERAIKEMKELDVIEPSTSSWSSPIVLVSKKDRSTRFCVDYRKLNITHKDSYPLPHIHDMIPLTSRVDIGKCPWMMLLKKRLPSRLEADYGSSKSCHLGYITPQQLSRG